MESDAKPIGSQRGGKVVHSFRENLLAFIFSSLFGVLVTVIVFYLTAPPTSSAEIRDRLIDITAKRVRSALALEVKPRLHIKRFISEQIDVSSESSIVIFGDFRSQGEDSEYRFLAVFEPAKQQLIDRLAGRSSFYELTSLSCFQAPFPDSLLADGLSAEDIDGDGTKEIHLRLKSTFADSVSIGPLFLRKRETKWTLIGLQSLRSLIYGIVVEDKPPHPLGIRPPPFSPPIPFFGMADKESPKKSPPMEDLAKAGFYEDEWQAYHDGKVIDFVTLRNSGTYIIRKHPIKGHTQIGVLGFFVDENSVLGAHYCMVAFLSFSGGDLAPDSILMPDLFWNWGYPMISNRAVQRSEVDFDSIAEAGILPHKVGNIFFGYTEFQRMPEGS